MAEGGASPRSESEGSLENTFERAMAELGIMFTESGDALQEAYSPEIRNLLSRASDSADTSPDSTDSSSGTTTPIPAPSYSRQIMIDFFRFINQDLMEVPTQQQLERFRKFLERIRSRLTSPASSSPDGTEATRQCLKVVEAMKAVFSTRFLILHEYLQDWMDQDPLVPCPGADNSASRPREHVSNTDPSGGTHPNAHERTEPVLRLCPPRNLGVIAVNPMHAPGNIELPTAGQQTPRSSVIIQVNPTSSGSDGAAEVDRRDRSSSPAKRKPLKRQSHVMEDEDK